MTDSYKTELSTQKTLVAIDVEATCWAPGETPQLSEIIEVGAVKIDPQRRELVGEFTKFIRPATNDALSAFCRRLTGIQQRDIDTAEPWPAVFEELRGFCGPDHYLWLSFGNFDCRIIEAENRRHGVEQPEFLQRHRNLKDLLPRALQCSRRAMRNHLSERIGNQPMPIHRALPDARYATRAIMSVLL